MTLQTLNFDKLPLWHGVSDRPVTKQFKPFRLSLNSWGLIKQAELTQELITHYESDSYQWITPPPGTSVWANYLGDLYFDYVKKIWGNKLAKGVISEIGAGSTYIAQKILQSFKPKQYNIVDPAIREKNGIENLKIFRSYLDDSFKENLNSEYILTLNVLEHVRDPLNFMQKIYANLNATGEAIMIFPNVESQFKNGDFNGLLHEHLNYFTKFSAEALFAQVGFEVLDFQSYEDTFYFHLKKNSGSIKNQNRIDEKQFAFAIEQFEKNQQYFMKEIASLIKQKKKIAFHGATNGLNNLLGLLVDVDFSNIELFDGDDFKTGKYISSFPKAIRNVKEYPQTQFDFVVISAMTFYEKIRQYLLKNTQYQDQQIRAIYPKSST